MQRIHVPGSVDNELWLELGLGHVAQLHVLGHLHLPENVLEHVLQRIFGQLIVLRIAQIDKQIKWVSINLTEVIEANLLTAVHGKAVPLKVQHLEGN